MASLLKRHGVAFATMALGVALAGCEAEESRPGEAVSMTDMGAYKAAYDTEPRPPVSDVESAKQREAKAHYEAKLKFKEGAEVQAMGDVSANAWYQSRILGYTHQGQWNNYYCGPAAVVSALALKGVSWDQGSAAHWLKTTPDGTAWYGIWVDTGNATGYPIRDVMNWMLGTTYYEPVALPYTPSQANIDTYIANMTYDIDRGWPVIGDAWQTPGGAHLVGHPSWLEIFHWFTINGYGNWGSTTAYMDSANTVWSSVPAYTSGFNSTTMAHILGGRGYIW